jgi:hypothetical protein
VRRVRTLIALAVVLLMLAFALAACGGSDDTSTTTTTAGAPNGDAAPPSSLGALPPGFVQCMADKGFGVDSPDDIHSAPPEVLQACFAH